MLRKTLIALGLAGWLTAQASFAQTASPAPAAPTVRLKTSMGNIVVQLDEARAPLSTANFLQYVKDGHYDGTILHRVIANFVVQGGGHLADGTEKPVRPPIPNESGNGLSNRRGTLALARENDPHSASAQFYINLIDNLSLDPQPSRWGYAVVGRVIEGMDVVDRIGNIATGARAPFAEDSPLEPVTLNKAVILSGAP
jgi:cyclophilin family peptidyl-prolyl cis-trans isomerase